MYLFLLLLNMYCLGTLLLSLVYIASLFSKDTRGFISFNTIFSWPFKLLNRLIKVVKFIYKEIK